MHRMATIPLAQHRRRAMQRSTLVQLTVGIAIGIALGAAFPRRHSEAVNDQRRTTNH